VASAREGESRIAFFQRYRSIKAKVSGHGHGKMTEHPVEGLASRLVD